MIHARISRRFAAAADSAAFSLSVEFQAMQGITVLFGPSGAGKTLTLDAIAGFSTPDSGRILLDDQILFDAAAQVNLRPRERNCGYVFQNYALFPHMTLRQNLVFGAERWPRLERHRRVNEMLDRFHLSDVSGRRPRELSGGQKQRCSIARALIGKPRLLLLDEPARGLDAPLRAELYSLLREIPSEFGIPVLLVTHDLEECFELADLMIVLREGTIVQTGAPRQILEQPASVEVARLLGTPNLFEAEITALDPGRNTSRLRVAGHELTGPYYPGHLRGDRVWICARAEDLHVAPPNGSRPAVNWIPAKLLRIAERPQGVRLEFAGGISVDVPREEFERQKDNREWLVEFPARALRVL